MCLLSLVQNDSRFCKRIQLNQFVCVKNNLLLRKMSYSEPNRSQTIHPFIVNKSHFFLRESGWKRLFPLESQIAFTAWALSLVVWDSDLFRSFVLSSFRLYSKNDWSEGIWWYWSVMVTNPNVTRRSKMIVSSIVSLVRLHLRVKL